MTVAMYLPDALRMIEKKTYLDQLLPETEGGVSIIELSSIANS